MFFLIRCVFWLTVVFSTIFNTDQRPVVPARQVEKVRLTETARPGRPAEAAAPEALGRMAQNWVATAIERLWNKSSGSCAGSPADCAALAARLSDFARHQGFDDPAAANAARAGPASAMAAQKSLPSPAGVPLPPLRPQHAHLLQHAHWLKTPADRESAREKPAFSRRAEKRSGQS